MVYGMCIGSKRDDRHVEMQGKKAGGVQNLCVYATHGRRGPDANGHVLYDACKLYERRVEAQVFRAHIMHARCASGALCVLRRVRGVHESRAGGYVRKPRRGRHGFVATSRR